MTYDITVSPTYYHLAREVEYAGPRDTPIYRQDGSVIATVPRHFVDNLCVEGSGKLADGRVINTAGSCSYGPACLTGSPECYHTVDAARYPWGVGVNGIALRPLRSIAVDRRQTPIPYGSDVYIPRFDGLRIPSIDGIGGFVHDGHFTAEDTGGWITGNHIDIFVGTMGMYHALERLVPTRSSLAARVTPGGGTAASRSIKPLLASIGIAGAILGGAYFFANRKKAGAGKWLGLAAFLPLIQP